MDYNRREPKEKGNEGNRTTVIEEGMYRDSRFDNRTQWLRDGHKRKKKVSCLRTHEKKNDLGQIHFRGSLSPFEDGTSLQEVERLSVS